MKRTSYIAAGGGSYIVPAGQLYFAAMPQSDIIFAPETAQSAISLAAGEYNCNAISLAKGEYN